MTKGAFSKQRAVGEVYELNSCHILYPNSKKYQKHYCISERRRALSYFAVYFMHAKRFHHQKSIFFSSYVYTDTINVCESTQKRIPVKWGPHSVPGKRAKKRSRDRYCARRTRRRMYSSTAITYSTARCPTHLRCQRLVRQNARRKEVRLRRRFVPEQPLFQ